MQSGWESITGLKGTWINFSPAFCPVLMATSSGGAFPVHKSLKAGHETAQNDGTMQPPSNGCTACSSGSGTVEMGVDIEPDRGAVDQGSKCRAYGCQNSLSGLKEYYIRRRICVKCIRSDSVLLDGELMLGPQRFCHQCGKFQSVSEFESNKRSCRTALQKRRRQPLKPQGSIKRPLALGELNGPSAAMAAAAAAAAAALAANGVPTSSQQQNPLASFAAATSVLATQLAAAQTPMLSSDLEKVFLGELANRLSSSHAPEAAAAPQQPQQQQQPVKMEIEESPARPDAPHQQQKQQQAEAAESKDRAQLMQQLLVQLQQLQQQKPTLATTQKINPLLNLPPALLARLAVAARVRAAAATAAGSGGVASPVGPASSGGPAIEREVESAPLPVMSWGAQVAATAAAAGGARAAGAPESSDAAEGQLARSRSCSALMGLLPATSPMVQEHELESGEPPLKRLSTSGNNSNNNNNNNSRASSPSRLRMCTLPQQSESLLEMVETALLFTSGSQRVRPGSPTATVSSGFQLGYQAPTAAAVGAGGVQQLQGVRCGAAMEPPVVCLPDSMMAEAAAASSRSANLPTLAVRAAAAAASAARAHSSGRGGTWELPGTGLKQQQQQQQQAGGMGSLLRLLDEEEEEDLLAEFLAFSQEKGPATAAKAQIAPADAAAAAATATRGPPSRQQSSNRSEAAAAAAAAAAGIVAGTSGVAGEGAGLSLECRMEAMLQTCRVGLQRDPVATLRKVEELQEQMLSLQQQLMKMRAEALKQQVAAQGAFPHVAMSQ